MKALRLSMSLPKLAHELQPGDVILDAERWNMGNGPCIVDAVLPQRSGHWQRFISANGETYRLHEDAGPFRVAAILPHEEPEPHDPRTLGSILRELGA